MHARDWVLHDLQNPILDTQVVRKNYKCQPMTLARQAYTKKRRNTVRVFISTAVDQCQMKPPLCAHPRQHDQILISRPLGCGQSMSTCTKPRPQSLCVDYNGGPSAICHTVRAVNIKCLDTMAVQCTYIQISNALSWAHLGCFPMYIDTWHARA